VEVDFGRIACVSFFGEGWEEDYLISDGKFQDHTCLGVVHCS
jgi:hypothetical protein